MSGYQQNNMNLGQMGMNQNQQGQQPMHQQMYQQQQHQQMGMGRMMGVQGGQQMQHGGMMNPNQGPPHSQPQQQQFQQFQQQQMPSSSMSGGHQQTPTSFMSSGVPQGQHQMQVGGKAFSTGRSPLQQQTGLLGQPPPQANPSISVMSSFGGQHLSSNSPMMSSMHRPMSTGSGNPSTPQQQQQLSVPPVSSSGETPSPSTGVGLNPESDQPPLSDAPASISSDTPTANSVLANTPGVASTPGPSSTAPAVDGQQNQADSAASTDDADVPACITHADPLNQAKHLMLNVIPGEVEDVLQFLSKYLQSEYEVSESQSDLGLGGPPSVADPPSVNDLQNGPGSVSVMDEAPHSVGGGLRVDSEGLKNYCESAVKSALNCLASIDTALGCLDVVKQSLAHVHSVEKSLHAQAVPSVPPQHVGGAAAQSQQANLAGSEANVALTQQAMERLQYQQQLSQSMSKGADAVRLLLAHSMHLPVDSLSNGFANGDDYMDHQGNLGENGGDMTGEGASAEVDFDAIMADNLCEASADVKTEVPISAMD
ncbi:hypothetical protein QR680_005258 [Steinernema hermaphroditum]|uniref:Uncharacterized protein n=1 Tax=Steinernema hermaphroditum TaxID=289476 RepID=A0AA39HRC8_9BILA|nr:hypothetical protein QR680_005258 [Steinernema hermaphroditum]